MISESQIRAAVRKVAAKEKPVVMLRDDGARGAGRLVFRARRSDDNIISEFYAVYFRAGRRATTKIGTYDPEGRSGGLTLADARKRFREEFAPAISAGTDPASVAARRQAQNKPGTVAELFAAYVERLRADGKRSADYVEGILLTGRNSVADYIGGDRPAATIEPGHLTPYLAAIYGRGCPVMAQKARIYLSAAFNFGMKSEHDYRRRAAAGASWGIKSNPVAAIPADSKASKPGQRFLAPVELRTFWNWLVDYEERSWLARALRLMICCGARLEEVLRVSTTVYDKSAALLYWEKTKNGRPHSVPLTHHAVAILDDLLPNRYGLYFPHRDDPSKPSPGELTEITDLFIAEYPEIPRFTPRDLRRTWKTTAGAAGLSKEIRDRIQNHTKSDVSARHYDRWEGLPEKRAAIEKWGAFLDGILSGEGVKPELSDSRASCQTQARRVSSKSGNAFSLNISEAFRCGADCCAIKPR
jgi:integrase